MNGLPVEAHLGKTPRELLPGLPIDEMEGAWREILRTGRPLLDVELAGETPAAPGKRRTWLESWYPVRSGDEILGARRARPRGHRGARGGGVPAERARGRRARPAQPALGHHDLGAAPPAPAPRTCRPSGSRLGGAHPRERRPHGADHPVLVDYARCAGGHGLPLHRRPLRPRRGLSARSRRSARRRTPGARCGRSGPGRSDGRVGPGPDRPGVANLRRERARLQPGGDARSSCRWRDEGDAVAVEVANEGAPIPPEVLPRALRAVPARRSDERAERRRTGSGSGSSSRVQIARPTAGRIDVRSARRRADGLHARAAARCQPRRCSPCQWRAAASVSAHISRDARDAAPAESRQRDAPRRCRSGRMSESDRCRNVPALAASASAVNRSTCTSLAQQDVDARRRPAP